VEKRTVAALLAQRGAFVIDADAISRCLHPQWRQRHAHHCKHF